MAISPLSNTVIASTLGSQTGTSNSKTTSSGKSATVGQQLLAALAQAQGATTNPLLQDQVSLNSGSGQNGNTPLTYDAKGLLQQLRNNMLNDPLLQGDNSNNDSQAQNLFSSLPTPSASTSSTASSAADAKAQALAVINGTASNNNANWAQMLKQNPALAGVMIDQQTSQSMISMLA